MSDLRTTHADASSSPGLSLWRVTNAWQRHVRAALAPHELTHVQFVLLASLTWMDRADPVSQRALAAHAGLDVMMTSQVLRTLEAKGFVIRRPHRLDRRAVEVEPTTAGVERANAAIGDVEAVDAEYFDTVPAAHREGFLLGLQTLAEVAAAR